MAISEFIIIINNNVILCNDDLKSLINTMFKEKISKQQFTHTEMSNTNLQR